MKLKYITRYGAAVLVASIGMAVSSGSVFAAKEEFKPLNEAEFEKAKAMYFQRCAGCHGVLRVGATGKNLEPKPNKAKKTKGTLKLGTKRLEKIITLGTEGGMNNFDDIFSKEEINLLARYIQMEPPVPPEMSLALMKERHKVFVEPKNYPTKPMHGRNWENFFIAIERDKGSIAVIDGDKKEVVAHIPTGYAVHVLKTVEHHQTLHAKDAGRFWYVMGRDGMMTKIDLWAMPDKMKVAQVQVAYDARDVAVSGDGKYVIGGGYWPPHFVIADAETMEPLKVVSSRGVNIDGEYVNESRVAA
ncbi:MAG: cytochrome D1 domain-containing protein, partial [Gammaproteobacteria bacterium]|nr:cytochrome D1 domain-containing protein [Gammaproteobacteria bacterium]